MKSHFVTFIFLAGLAGCAWDPSESYGIAHTVRANPATDASNDSLHAAHAADNGKVDDNSHAHAGQ
jgi:hypothetical protein